MAPSLLATVEYQARLYWHLADCRYEESTAMLLLVSCDSKRPQLAGHRSGSPEPRRSVALAYPHLDLRLAAAAR